MEAQAAAAAIAVLVLFAILGVVGSVFVARSNEMDKQRLVEEDTQRREFLTKKYNDKAIVDRLVARTIWQGMSEEQLIKSWGQPDAVDRKVYKTKTVATFKYGAMTRNRYANRVKLENGSVVGWQSIG